MKTIIHAIKVDNCSSIKLTLKSNAVNIFTEPENNLWTFDLEGRLVGMFINNKNYRRTLSNKYYLKSRTEKCNETFRMVNEVPKSEVIPLLEKCYVIIEKYRNELPNSFNQYLKKISKIDYDALDESAKEFSNIYLPISILPPDQYMSLVFQLTEGCNYNQCTFCNFYKDRPFKIKSLDEFYNHIQSIKSFFGDGINLRKSIFLADANAISVPQNRLIDSLKMINNQLPQFKNIYSFVDVFTGIKKSAKDYKELKELGLKRVYLGVESGNNNLMLFLNKKQLNKDIIKLTRDLKTGGIDVGIIFLIGAGGEHFAEKHLNDSLDLLKELPLSKGDIIYLSELNETNSEYIDSMEKMKYNVPSKSQIRKWSNEFRYKTKEVVSKEIQVSIYDINQFFY